MDKHRFDAASFVLAVLVLGLGIYFMSGAHGPVRVFPIVIMGLGAAVVAGAIQRTSGHAEVPTGATPSAVSPVDGFNEPEPLKEN